jgi:exodeoxyribonuclease V beta subunit
MSAHDFVALDVFHCELGGIRQIEASAGTGKTWNICGLYLRLLLERGLEVQRILVVTFTNAATAELRERIRQRVVDTLAFLQPGALPAAGGGDDFVPRLVAAVRDRQGLSDDAMRGRLALALATFDEAAIFTIHGFCQRALADTPFTAQMPLALELVQDDGPWIAEAANDFWRRVVAADDLEPGLAAHLVASKDSPQRFAALLKRHLSKPLARSSWPDGIERVQRIDSQELDAAHAHAVQLWATHRDAMEDLLMRSLGSLSAVSYKEETVRAALAGWAELLRASDGASALGLAPPKLDLLGAARLAKGTKKKMVTPEHAFFDIAQHIIELREKARGALALQRLALLRQLLAEGAAAQRDAKRRQRVIAFDDMLFNLHERLTDGDSPWLAAALKARFPAALIDEFQDTDPLQFAIFRTIYTAPDAVDTGPGDGDAPLFFVGDPKQAIYSFRNADLHTYLAAGRHAVARYSLSENQRSVGPLIHALNRLFMANGRAFMQDGLGYQEIRVGAKPRQPLVDTSAPAAAVSPLHVWMLPDDPDSGEPMLRRDAKAAAVDATAAEIARLLAAAQRGEVLLAGRPLAAGDIAVLVRSNADGSLMRQALSALGVGSVELSQASVFLSSDAEDLDRLLTAILEPARERKLKAALATEAMGRDAAAITALAGDEAGLLAEVQRFAGWRDTWAQRGVGFMLRQWLAAENVAGRLLARPDGERRLTNLLHLVECLHEAGAAHASPDTLLRWFQSQRLSPAASEATQLRLESDRNLVQIVTIHKSKGLEYPIVFCPFLWGAAAGGARDKVDGVAYHDEAGEAVIDYGLEFADDARQDEVKQRLRLAESAETLRLVYVALTRAVHRCVLVAGCYRVPGKNPHATGSTRSLLNWLVAGDGLTPGEWFEHKQGVAPIKAAWQALAAGSDGAIAVTPLPQAPGRPLRAPRLSPDTLAALPAPRTLSPGWWIGSFSALAHGATHERSGVDHDLRAIDPVDGPEPDETAEPITADDALNFPRGPAAGECIHQAFERIDFTAPETWPEQVSQAVRTLRALGTDGRLRRADAAATPAETDALRERMLQRLVRDVLDTPLAIGTDTPLQLSTLPPARKRVELEFHLPSHALDAGALAALLADSGVAMPRLAFAPLRGFLKGFIDLVFEHEGRYFVLDWKSNHLGDTPAAYGQAPMAEAMASHGYHLQALLYLVALDRYLAQRIPAYRREQHLGGAVYLFVRGVRPGWRDAGVFFHRPADATIARLSALFDDAPAIA